MRANGADTFSIKCPPCFGRILWFICRSFLSKLMEIPSCQRHASFFILWSTMRHWLWLTACFCDSCCFVVEKLWHKTNKSCKLLDFYKNCFAFQKTFMFFRAPGGKSARFVRALAFLWLSCSFNGHRRCFLFSSLHKQHNILHPITSLYPHISFT